MRASHCLPVCLIAWLTLCGLATAQNIDKPVPTGRAVYDTLPPAAQAHCVANWEGKGNEIRQRIGGVQAKRKRNNSARVRKQYDGQIAALQAEYQAWERNHPPLLPWLREGFGKGDIGHLRTIKVIQVMPDDGVILCRLEHLREQPMVLIVGLKTDDIASDDRLKIDWPVEAVMTHTYTTALGGTNTVYVLRRFDPQTLLEP